MIVGFQVDFSQQLYFVTMSRNMKPQTFTSKIKTQSPVYVLRKAAVEHFLL